MASLPSFTQFCSVPRWQSNLPSLCFINCLQFSQVIRPHSRFVVTAVPRKKQPEKTSDGEEDDSEKKTTRKRAPSRRRKKAESDVTEETPVLEGNVSNVDGETSLTSESAEPEKPPRRTRKKETVVVSTSSNLNEEPEKKVTRRRRTKKTVEDTVNEASETELSETEDETDNERDLEVDASGGEDISFTYAWPPLICCFGPIQHAFVPSGRRANRLIDHESHERMKDALWAPEKFVRAPGGCAANMKMSKRGPLRMTCVGPCAEDALRKTEINIDVLKEAKMFYFNSFSLLDRKTKTSALQAIKISKQFGGLIFFDLNLPLPLWHSVEETWSVIQEALELADIIEVTKQELEFLCGIVASERFDTKDNDRSKFVHYSPDIISPILHDNLQVLFVTNGTSKVHYYTKDHNGSVLGMEDPPITPFTSDMSAAGDGLVAGLVSKLIVQPHLMTNKEYLIHSIDYAINRGVTEQWLQARTRGYPPKPGMEDDVFFPDPNGLRTITEKAFRTLFPVNDDDDSEELGVTVNRHDDDSEEEDGDNADRHNDYDSEDISDVEFDDEEPVRKVNQSIRA
ncbi:putative fructokinase [Helianthus debilis subsp. tardiflorus]